MRNAFVEGLTSGYAHLPPATAPKKQSVVKQGVECADRIAAAQGAAHAAVDPAPSAPASPPSSSSGASK